MCLGKYRYDTVAHRCRGKSPPTLATTLASLEFAYDAVYTGRRTASPPSARRSRKTTTRSKRTHANPAGWDMTGTTHALVGMVLGRFLHNRRQAFLAGLATHAVLDALPHQNYNPVVGLPLDGCGVVAVLTAASRSTLPGALAGAVGGLLADLENLVPNRYLDRTKLFPSHRRGSHWFGHNKSSRRVGVAVELLTIAGALLLLCALPRQSAETGAHRAEVVRVT